MKDIEPIHAKHDRAITLWERGKWKEASKLFDEVLAECPEHLHTYVNYGCLVESRRDRQRAVEMWRKGVRVGLGCIPPEFAFGKDRIGYYHEDNRSFLLAYLNLGSGYYKLKRTHEALTCYQNILLLDSSREAARVMEKRCLNRLKKERKIALSAK